MFVHFFDRNTSSRFLFDSDRDAPITAHTDDFRRDVEARRHFCEIHEKMTWGKKWANGNGRPKIKRRSAITGAMYSTKCVETRNKIRGQSHIPKLDTSCGGHGPPPCASGDRQVGELYVEAAAIVMPNATTSKQLVLNVVRNCERERQ